ncbi:hypothetical protein P152DRAFT_344023 [Eremomyces bilateralis CBS 781.70]|uniref:Uncharacterized protein n=1 Tax=Eremomyces bilateralis CBS 781.70 TaxID=1392243 RepID=A0A6G1G3H6_9PEZI|nr:uncharacterized protein P152DRAFT_344023 [Eremomyces bilateralis CBS 781.70]KAF1812614.1 hypothetical protein P152DRAFT_344023 [Eremomyces bilateralis CBS 781.70]
MAFLNFAKAFIGRILSRNKVPRTKEQKEVVSLQNFLFCILAVDYNVHNNIKARVDVQDCHRYRSFSQKWSVLKSATLEGKAKNKDLARARKEFLKIIYRPATALGINPANIITRLLNYDTITSHYGEYQSCNEVYNKVLGVVARDSQVRMDQTWVAKVAPNENSAQILAEAVEKQLDECSITSEAELLMTRVQPGMNALLVKQMVPEDGNLADERAPMEMWMDHHGRELRRWIECIPHDF